MKINSPCDTYATLVTSSTRNNYEKKNSLEWKNDLILKSFPLKTYKNKNNKFT